MRSQFIFPHFAIIAILFKQFLESNGTDFSAYKTIDTGSPPAFSCNNYEKERLVLRDPCGTFASPCYPQNYPTDIGEGIKIYDLNANNGTTVVGYQFTIEDFETITLGGYLYFIPAAWARYRDGLLQRGASTAQIFIYGSASSSSGAFIGGPNRGIIVNARFGLPSTSYILNFYSNNLNKRGFKISYCADFNLCETDVICSTPDGGKCNKKGFRSYYCVCNTGYTGTTCVDVNECLTSPCDSKAHCENIPGSFRCKCNNGYIGDGFSCAISDRCIIENGNNCSLNANCTNIQDGFDCTCKNGFIGDGVVCIADQTKVALKNSTLSATATNTTLSTSTTPSNSTSSASNTSLTRNNASDILDRNDTALLETEENDVSSDGNNTGTIIGVIGAILFGILSLVLFLFFRKKRENPEEPTYKGSEIPGKNNSTYNYGSTTQYNTKVYK